jgi:hypothetical protein
MNYKLRILSLGAGVQSTTLLLMAERGEIEPFHCAIFADTGWEGQATYTHLEWLKQVGKTPIIITGKDRNIFHDHLTHKRNCLIPVYTKNNGNSGMSHRLCTNEYKLVPIKKEVRKLLGLLPRQRAPRGAVEMIIGISLDEKQRIRASQDKMTDLKYPLIDKRMDRYACMQWLSRNFAGLVVPKSSCVGCPFHSNAEWRNLNPDEWKQAIELDRRIRNIHAMRAELFLHKSRIPLAEVDLRTPEERGQLAFDFDDAISLRCKEQKLDIMVNGLSNL